jgi:hypothetical protein
LLSDISHARTMSSRTAIATLLIHAAFTADLHGCVRIESGGCICITNSKQLSHRLSGSFLIHATLRLGNAERFRKTVCRQLSFGARPFSLPTKSDASPCMRTGPGAMRLTRLGKDRLAFLAHHANHRCGGTTRVWCSVEEGSEAGVLVVKQRFPKGSPPTCTHERQQRGARVRRDTTLSPLAVKEICVAEPLPHGERRTKEKLGKKSVLTAQGLPWQALRLNPLLGLGETGVSARWSKMDMHAASDQWTSRSHLHRGCLPAWGTEGGQPEDSW